LLLLHWLLVAKKKSRHRLPHLHPLQLLKALLLLPLKLLLLLALPWAMPLLLLAPLSATPLLLLALP
jgi:hypothetical protein